VTVERGKSFDASLSYKPEDADITGIRWGYRVAGETGAFTAFPDAFDTPASINTGILEVGNYEVKAFIFGIDKVSYKSTSNSINLTVTAAKPPIDNWGDLEDLPDIKKLFGDVSEIPPEIWFVFTGDDTVYGRSDAPQITKVSRNYTSTGIIFNDEIYVFYGNVRLAEGRDYKVKYRNNTEAAQASTQMDSPAVILKGMGGCYKGSEDFRFTISDEQPVKIDADVKIAGLNTKPEYTGSILTLDDLYTSSDKSGYGKVTLYTEKDGVKTELTEGQDYNFDDTQLRKEGSFALMFELTGKYEGSVISAPITVQPYNVKNHVKSGDSKVTVQIEENPLFVKSGAEPKITVKFNETELKQGVDYSVSYSRNKRLGQKAKARINFMGYFSGSVVEYFETARKDVSLLTVQTTDKKYKETPGNFKILPVICDGDKTVSKSKDIYKYNIADCEYYYAEGEHKKIADDEIVPGNTLIEVKVNVKSRENGPYTGEAQLSGYYRVYGTDKNIKKAVLSPRKIVLYSNAGEEIRPVYKQDYMLTMPGETAPLSEECFEVVSVTRNRFIGTATVTVRGKNGYGGTKRFTFKVIKRRM
jgi:hypothetical protein